MSSLNLRGEGTLSRQSPGVDPCTGTPGPRHFPGTCQLLTGHCHPYSAAWSQTAGVIPRVPLALPPRATALQAASLHAPSSPALPIATATAPSPWAWTASLPSSCCTARCPMTTDPAQSHGRPSPLLGTSLALYLSLRTRFLPAASEAPRPNQGAARVSPSPSAPSCRTLSSPTRLASSLASSPQGLCTHSSHRPAKRQFLVRRSLAYVGLSQEAPLPQSL